MGNEALYVNRVVAPQPDLGITTRGSDWLYAVCAIMSVSCLATVAHSMTVPHSRRLFHQITGMLLLVAAIAYFSMASNLGQVPIQAEFVRRGSSQVGAAGTREIFYARYIDWFVTTPLLLTDLLLTAGVPWSTIMATILADEIMVVCGLIGALTQTSYKWGFWVFGMFAFFYVVYNILVVGRRGATVLGGWARTTYYACGVLTIFLWFLYPIAWGVCEGGNVIHPDSEAIFYGVLDVLAKPVFSAILLYGHTKIDFATLGLGVREPGHPNGHAHHEKAATADYQNGAHNGASNGAHNGVSNGASSANGAQPPVAA